MSTLTLQQRLSTAAALAAVTTLTLSACSMLPMSKEEAGDRYLEIMCPANFASEILDNAVQAQDLAAINAAAEMRIEAVRLAATQLTASDARWPSEVSPDDTEAISDYFMASISTLESLKSATTLPETLVIYPDGTEFQAAAQTIRLELGLSSDVVASCADYESRGSLER